MIMNTKAFKKVLTGISVAILASSPSALAAVRAQDAPRFLALHSDQANYTVGQKAVLTAYEQILPSDPDYELYLSATLAGQAIAVTQISETQAASVTPTLSQAGNLDWVVNVYLENKDLAQQLNQAISFYTAEICTLNDRLAQTTDPDQRAQIQAQITRDQGLISSSQQELSDNRRLIEQDTLTLTINAARPVVAALDSVPATPVLTVQADHDFDQYAVGDSATFTVHVNTSFSGPDGDQENVVRATFDDQAVGVTDLGPVDFASTIGPFLANQVGQHHYNATLWTRSKAQADSLRDGVAQASQQRAGFVAKRDATDDPMEKAYDQSQIDDLTSVIASFDAQLGAILTQAGTGSVGITVVSSRSSGLL